MFCMCVGELSPLVYLCRIFRCQIYYYNYCTVVMHAGYIVYSVLICTDINVIITCLHIRSNKEKNKQCSLFYLFFGLI